MSPPITPRRLEPALTASLNVKDEPRTPNNHAASSIAPAAANSPLSRFSPPHFSQIKQADPVSIEKNHDASLEQQAELSTREKVTDLAYRGFWWTCSIPPTVFTVSVNFLLDKVKDTLIHKVAKKGVNILGTSTPETPLRALRNCLAELNENVSTGIEINAALRERCINALTEFLAHQRTHLEESIHPTSGFREALNYQQEKQFAILLRALKENIPLKKLFIQPLFEFIENSWKYQIEFHEKKAAAQLVKTFSSPAPIDAPSNPTRPKRRRFYSVSQTASDKAHKNSIPAIAAEIDNLKSVGFKIALAYLILPESRLHKAEGENGGLLADLIKKSNDTLDPLKDSNEIFQNLIFTELDNSDLNFFQRTWKKFTCLLLSPSLLYMFDHVLDQSRDIVLHLIGQSPEERMKMLVKMFIEPSRKFIGKLQSEYIQLAQHPAVGTTTEEAISNAIAQIKIKDLTPRNLIDRLVSTWIDRFAPEFDWSSVATLHFKKRAEQSKTSFMRLGFTFLSYLSWAINIVSAPGRWCLHKVIRIIVKTIAVSKIHAKLQDTSESSWDFGSLAVHSLYKTLYAKLQKKNRADPGSEAKDTQRKLAIEQTAFVDKGVQDNIRTLVSSFLNLLSFQGFDLIGLFKKSIPANAVEGTKNAAIELVFPLLSKKATEQIIQGLQIFLEEETFSEGILEVLQDIHQQCLHFNAGSTGTNLVRLENDFYIELQDAVKHGVQEIINDKLDPSKTLQEKADLFIDSIIYYVASFKNEFDATPTMENLTRLRDRFLIDAFRRLREETERETNASAKPHIERIAASFTNLSRPISHKIDDLVKLADEQKKVEIGIKDLKQLKGSLEKALSSTPLLNATTHYQELQLTLQKIKNKTYPNRIQDLISTLLGNFDVWRTEAAKKDNQTLLNGTIKELAQAVQKAIDENENNDLRLKEKIFSKSEKTKQLIQLLNEWAGKLTHFTCKPEQQQIDILKQFLPRLAEAGLAPLILDQLDAFFLFLGKNHNIKGLLWYVIKAYLEMPQKSPQEFKKTLDKVKLKLHQKPLSLPTSPNPST